MSPVLNCVPSSPPPEQDVYPKVGSVASDGGSSNRPSPVSEVSPARAVPDSNPESENSCCDDTRTDETKRPGTPNGAVPSVTIANNNNNSIPLNYKKSPSPNEGLTFEPPIRPWNSSPNFRTVERGHSVSPSSSCPRPSPCPRNSLSPLDVSSDASRNPSQASSEAQPHEFLVSPDSFRSPKVCPGDGPYDVPFLFHDNRLSSDSFRFSNSFVTDPMNPYLRLGHPLGPFQPPPDFLGPGPFLGPNDPPKLLLNGPGLGFITQHLHHLNGQLSSSPGKIPGGDLHRMSVQQLQFLQNHLQSHLPGLLSQPASYAKFPDPKSQLSMLIQARKHGKTADSDPENGKRDTFPNLNGPRGESKDRRIPRTTDPVVKPRKMSVDEGMDVDTYDGQNSDSDELLSVGSVSPPPPPVSHAQQQQQSPPSPLLPNPPPPVTQPRCDKPKANEPGSRGLTPCSTLFPNRTVNGSGGPKRHGTVDAAVRHPPCDGVTNTKTSNPSNRTLKFSIDNILKSDFGGEDIFKEPKQVEAKKQCKESDGRTFGTGTKKPETGNGEKPVDLSQDGTGANPGGGGGGGDAPMLWPAWVYCTRYSDRPSSGPRTRRSKNKDKNPEEKRPRTAFSGDQLSRLKHEFAENRYLTERRRQDLARELGLNEAQIKIWFQNKRAKMKKARGEKNPLALQLMAQGLYNHSTIPLTKEEEEAAAAELSD